MHSVVSKGALYCCMCAAPACSFAPIVLETRLVPIWQGFLPRLPSRAAPSPGRRTMSGASKRGMCTWRARHHVGGVGRAPCLNRLSACTTFRKRLRPQYKADNVEPRLERDTDLLGSDTTVRRAELDPQAVATSRLQELLRQASRSVSQQRGGSVRPVPAFAARAACAFRACLPACLRHTPSHDVTLTALAPRAALPPTAAMTSFVGRSPTWVPTPFGRCSSAQTC